MNRPLLCWLPLLLLAPMLLDSASYGQPVPTATLTPSSQTLQLPGSLTLNAILAPSSATAGMPSGSVQFFYGGTSPLGTAPPSVIPSTENFSAPAIPGSFGNQPFGLFTLNSSSSRYSTLGMLDYYVQPLAPVAAGNPEITIYSGQGASLFQTSTTYQIPNSSPLYNNVDGYAIADFNHDGIPDVLLHGYAPGLSGNAISQEVYFVLLGNPDGTYGTTEQYPTPTEVVSPDFGPTDGSDPTEVITVDDFNGDGYPDVAYAEYYGGAIGVALNAGTSQPGSFPESAFIAAPSVTGGAAAETFNPSAIASGHFTSSGHTDLVVAGILTNVTTGVSMSEVALFPGKGDGTLGSPTTFATGPNPCAIATADLRNDGLTDVVVANQSSGQICIDTDATSGNIQVLFGDGQGNLTTSSTVTLSIVPESLLIQDFNGDGYPDILVTGIDGSLSLVLNDGTGHFSTATAVGTATTVTSLTAAGDFNGDGLNDIAELTDYSLSDSSQISSAFELLNSASSQATLTTAPQTLPAGTQTLTATFPGDNNFAASTSAGVPVIVTQTVPTLSWAPPAPMQYGLPLSTTQLDATSNVGGTITYNPPAGTVLPLGSTTVTATFLPSDSFDYTGATASQTISVVAAPATATATVPSATLAAGQNSSVTLTVGSYPVPITATLTLSFTPDPPNTLTDPTVVFPNNTDTTTINIPANNGAPIPAVDFSPGSTAGTITLTVQLTAGGANITPANLVPIVITVPAAPPIINSATLTRGGETMTVAILGLSSTRDMTQATFHFTAAPGQSLKTTDLTVQLGTPFSSWYQSADSDQFGTTFLYTQPFTLNSDATSVGSVTVTLTNSQGASQPATAQ
ncbi:MAG: FG-GAP-like repeat-containing protein [Silvibacterium sp.]